MKICRLSSARKPRNSTSSDLLTVTNFLAERMNGERINTQNIPYLQNFRRLKFRRFFFIFGRLISGHIFVTSDKFRAKNSDTKTQLSKFMPTTNEWNWKRGWENCSFTALSRVYRYTDEKVTQILSSHDSCQAMSRLQFTT